MLVKVDHNYGEPGNLKYATENGKAVENAVIRIWQKIDFDTGNTSNPLAITSTDANGEWVDPVFLTAGVTYVVQFHKQMVCGPDHREIIV
jgi:hypothetical protein